MPNKAKVVPYLLVLPPSPPIPPSTPNKYIEDDGYYYRRRNKTWVSSLTCNCFSSFFAGLALTTLLIMAVAIPLLVFLSISVTETSSTTDTISTNISTTMITSSVSTTTVISCSTTCSSLQTCFKGVCVGIGYLSFVLEWSRPGDGNIVVTTPNGYAIYNSNTGPSLYTDEGELEIDDKNGTGPENVFWSYRSSGPPKGDYYICFEPSSFTPRITNKNPVTVTLYIMYSTNITLTVTKNVTSSQGNWFECDSTSLTLITSFTYI